jgi:putative oxidoreductase
MLERKGSAGMSLLFTIARILFSVIFVVSGTLKLMNISGTAAYIASKVAIPTQLSDLAAQAESATGMQAPQLIAIGAGLVELIFGLLLAFGVAVRLASVVLAIFTLVATFYFHDFWNQVDPDRTMNMIQAEKNLSIFAGLLVFFVLGSWRPAAAAEVDEYYAPPARSDEIKRDPLSPA